jgi:hypothetical protein
LGLPSAHTFTLRSSPPVASTLYERLPSDTQCTLPECAANSCSIDSGTRVARVRSLALRLNIGGSRRETTDTSRARTARGRGAQILKCGRLGRQHRGTQAPSADLKLERPRPRRHRRRARLSNERPGDGASFVLFFLHFVGNLRQMLAIRTLGRVCAGGAARKSAAAAAPAARTLFAPAYRAPQVRYLRSAAGRRTPSRNASCELDRAAWNGRRL